MSLKPEDLDTYEEALELRENIRESFRELDSDMKSLSENPPLEEVEKIASKWKERAADLQEVKT